MDTTYHSNIPIEALSLLDRDVRNFNFIHPITSSIIWNTFENQMLPVKLVLASQTMQNVHYFVTHVILALISLNVRIATTRILFHTHVIQDSLMPVVLNMPNSLQPRLPILIDTLYLLFPKNLETGSDRIVLDSIYCLLLQETPFPFSPINLLLINSKRIRIIFVKQEPKPLKTNSIN